MKIRNLFTRLRNLLTKGKTATATKPVLNAHEVLRLSGQLNVAQVAMRNNPAPAATLREVADLLTRCEITADPKIKTHDLRSLADVLDQHSDRDQVRILQSHPAGMVKLRVPSSIA